VRLHEHPWGDPSAPQVICVHGVGGHGRRFRHLAEERLAARFHVRGLDLRGHGGSGWDPPWTIATHVGDLRETVSSPATWIGHSFGGRLVIELAAREPSLVERAVLIDPAIWVPPDIARERAEEELLDESFATAEEAVQARADGTGLGWLAHTPREFLVEEVREHLAESQDGRLRFRYSSEAVAAAYHEMANPPPAFQTVRIPTLLVAATYSKLVSASEVEFYRAALGGLLQVVVVPGGHIPLWDAYEATADAIESFLR
jgi:lipase